jgi:hemerythrin
MVSAVSIAAFLKGWLTQHILGTDKLYGQFITAGAAR